MATKSARSSVPGQTKSVLVWQMDPGRLEQADGLTHAEVFGSDPDHTQWCREPARSHVHKEDVAAFDAGLRRCLETGVMDLDVRVGWPDGSVRNIAVRGQLLPDEGGIRGGVVGVAIDATAIRDQQSAQRVAGDRHRFLLGLSDQLRVIDDEEEISGLATRLVAEHLEVDRCFFYRFYDDEDRMTIVSGYARPDLPPLHGDVRRSDFPELLVPLETGPFIVEDVSHYDGFSDQRKTGLIGAGIASFVAVGLSRGQSNPVWGIAVTTTTPRAWDPYDVDMLADAASRVWPAIERARALGALRASQVELERANAELERLNRGLGRAVTERTEELVRSEVRFRQAFELGHVAACITDENGERLLEVNHAFTDLTGYTADEALGETIERLGLWPERRDRDRLKEAYRMAERFDDLELRLSLKDQTVRDVLASGDRIRLNGAYGWLLNLLDVTDRKRSQEELLRAIQEVMSDTNWFSQRLIERLAQAQGNVETPAGGETLSDREHQVLTRVSRGMTNEEIAEELNISARTVRNHIANIYGKIGVHSRAEAVVWARERGLTT